MHLAQKTCFKFKFFYLILFIFSSLTTLSAQTNTIIEDKYQASRLLTQTTFGPTQKSIEELLSYETYEDWIDYQIALKPTKMYNLVKKYKDPNSPRAHNEAFFKAILTNKDQLRQRVAFALSEIFVAKLSKSNYAAQEKHYYDILSSNAFGNFRTLLEEITLSPVMGHYLDMLKNKKANPKKNTHPDENYAREIMQLFTVGLVQLNLDGTPKLIEGKQVPTYTQKHIEGTAAVFTGFSFDGESFSKAKNFINPMVCWPEHHETGEKVIIDDVIIPANQSCERDLEIVLNTLFDHPNVGPFISKQLIQKLVTSNPSSEYVSSVASVFNDNGDGVRGDLEAVIKAILTNDEALYGNQNLPEQFGKVKEPIIRISTLYRNILASNNKNFSPKLVKVHQNFMRAPNVFSFFRPDYTEVGVLQNNNLVAPELEIATEGNLIDLANSFYNILTKSGKNTIQIDLSDFMTLVRQPEELVEKYNLIFMAGAMSDDMKTNLTQYIQSIEIPELKVFVAPQEPTFEEYVYNEQLTKKENNILKKAHNKDIKLAKKEYKTMVNKMKNSIKRENKINAKLIPQREKQRIINSMHLLLTSAQQAVQQ